MKKIKLIEFQSSSGEILRGILTTSKTVDGIVLMCGGFERTATTEKKFKMLADKLVENDIASFRFDFSGTGLSDGDFSKTTIKKVTADILKAVDTLRKETSGKVHVVAHSLSACAISILLQKSIFEKIVFLAPALNQKDLLRFWFTSSQEKKNNNNVSWSNYKNFLDEELFTKDCNRTDKMTKANYIAAEYFLENEGKDYSELITDSNNILLIQGADDDKVPFENTYIEFTNTIIVKDGDHDLERPDMMNQWINEAINFIKEI